MIAVASNHHEKRRIVSCASFLGTGEPLVPHNFDLFLKFKGRIVS
jgi:hypothetical protein